MSEVDMRDVDGIYGHVGAIDFLLKRLLASHAEIYPTGVAARMLEEEEEVLSSIDQVKISEFQMIVMKEHIRVVFRDVRTLLDKRPTR